MKLQATVKILFFLALTVLLANCSKEEIIPENIEVNDFVWGGMNAYYKFQGNIEDLADTKFSNRNELNGYLEGFNSPVDLFTSITVETTSRITDDYTILEDELNGVVLTNGLNVGGTTLADSFGTLGYFAVVNSVVAGSSADMNGITGGMIFSMANGTAITEDNFTALFSADTILLTEVALNAGTGLFEPTGNTFSVVETLVEQNPIQLATTISDSGQEIGYLVYNFFSEAHHQELNEVFAQFRADEIDELIIDLRFNTGFGSTDTVTYLGSMITGQFDGEVFSKQIWNDKVMSNINNTNLTTFFTDEIEYSDGTSERINALGLNNIYFIVSDITSSGALVLINSLKAYDDEINVFLVGSETDDNYLATTILYDSDDYTKAGENFNTNHTWAIEPLIFEVFNKDNVNSGFIPDIEIAGNPNPLIGDPSEVLLARTLTLIRTGSRPTATKTTSSKTSNAKVMTPFSNKMYFNF